MILYVKKAPLSGQTFGFQWHLTDRCNLRCAHCYQEGYTSQGEQSLDALKDAADRIFAAIPDRAVSVNLTGGEPLMFPGLLGLIEHLHSFPVLEEVAIITNGTVVTDEIIEGLKAFPRVSCLKVSLESGDAGTNDRVRGPGTLSCVLRNIPQLRRAGKSIVLITTLARYNLASLEGLVRLARDEGLDGVIVERFVPLGQGRGLADQALGPEDWGAASQAMARMGGDDNDSSDLLPFRAFWVSMEPCADTLRGALCNLGDESMALMPDGTVYPCRRFPMAVGNVFSEPFEGILARLESFRPSAIRSRLTGRLCSACSVEGCAGCRALALALSGDALADDPQCPLALHGT